MDQIGEVMRTPLIEGMVDMGIAVAARLCSSALFGLRVLLVSSEIDNDARLVAHYPRIMTGR